MGRAVGARLCHRGALLHVRAWTGDNPHAGRGTHTQEGEPTRRKEGEQGQYLQGWGGRLGTTFVTVEPIFRWVTTRIKVMTAGRWCVEMGS